MQIRVYLIAIIPLTLIAGGKPPDDNPQNTTASSTRAQSSTDSSGVGQNKEGSYVSHTFNPRAALMAGAGAGINQANDTPHEWGQGAVGFGRRFASAFGKHIVHKTIQYPIARLLHEELSYHPSGKVGFRPRLKAALLGSVIRHRTTTGKSTLAVGEITGAIGSGLISRLWQPASTASMATGFASGGITLGIDTGLNIVKEFWPEIRHPRQHARAHVAPQPLEAEADLLSTPDDENSPEKPYEATYPVAEDKRYGRALGIR